MFFFVIGHFCSKRLHIFIFAFTGCVVPQKFLVTLELRTILDSCRTCSAGCAICVYCMNCKSRIGWNEVVAIPPTGHQYQQGLKCEATRQLLLWDQSHWLSGVQVSGLACAWTPWLVWAISLPSFQCSVSVIGRMICVSWNISLKTNSFDSWACSQDPVVGFFSGFISCDNWCQQAKKKEVRTDEWAT